MSGRRAMAARELAKVVWRWRYVPSQTLQDFRYHRKFRDQPTSVLHRFVEQQGLLWHNRIRAIDYYELGLYDPEMPPEAKGRYVGQFRTRQVLAAINAEALRRDTDEKLQFDALVRKAQLPVPEILAVVTREPTSGDYYPIADRQALESWLDCHLAADIVLKPARGLKGWGVLSLAAPRAEGGSWARLPSRESMDAAAIWSHCEPYMGRGGMVVQRRLKPHPVLASFAPDVLHTVRAITYLNTKPRIVDTILRVGSGQTATDNISQRGIAVPVDLASGRCGRGSMNVGGVPKYMDRHPVSGVPITDVVLPDWDAVCALAKAAAQTFSKQTTVGWDIGLTDSGPVLLEGNWCYAVRANQLANRKGMLDTPWLEVCNNEGGYRYIGLGLSRRQR
jgi:hypothetical protein